MVNIIAWTGFGIQLGFALLIDVFLTFPHLFLGSSIDFKLPNDLYPILFLVSITGAFYTCYLLTYPPGISESLQFGQKGDYHLQVSQKWQYCEQRMGPVFCSFVFISVQIAILSAFSYSIAFETFFSWIYVGFMGLLALFLIVWMNIKNAWDY